MTRIEIIRLLASTDEAAENKLFARAREMKKRVFGTRVYLRGLLELSNSCAKDCFYCGIRRGNFAVNRYRVPVAEAVRMARFAVEKRYGSVVLQSGEIESEENTRYIEDIVRGIRAEAGPEFGITLCLGEQTQEVYRRWQEVGANRYLLRIETSSADLYRQIHPAECDFQRRVRCLRLLREMGYEVGSGVLIGLPGQTVEHLAEDLIFLKETGVHMVGMGPFIPHHQTPMGLEPEPPELGQARFKLTLKMIAVLRLVLPRVNIAATTALQALVENGREQGLQAGANVLMPNITDIRYRDHYRLYENKPCVDEDSEKCLQCLQGRVRGVGDEIAWGERGNSREFEQPTGI